MKKLQSSLGIAPIVIILIIVGVLAASGGVYYYKYKIQKENNLPQAGIANPRFGLL